MATITGTNGNDQGILGAVQPRLLGLPNPLDLSNDLLLGLVEMMKSMAFLAMTLCLVVLALIP